MACIILIAQVMKGKAGIQEVQDVIILKVQVPEVKLDVPSPVIIQRLGVHL